jgi:phosphoribosylanthranilate isomerase
MSFLVKICGITRPEDARQAVAAGADLIGLNFWRGSKRFVEEKQAHEIVAAIPTGVLKVGVFVNAHPLVVTETMAELKLDRAQLHGDEIATSWNWMQPDQVIRAVRVRDQASLKDALAWEAGLFLYDAYAEGYGGSGQRGPWEVVAAGARRPFLIAGGLNPSNVTAAIVATRPDGVDVSSGVESARGIKDLRKLRAFIKQARAAAAQLK